MFLCVCVCVCVCVTPAAAVRAAGGGGGQCVSLAVRPAGEGLPHRSRSARHRAAAPPADGSPRAETRCAAALRLGQRSAPHTHVLCSHTVCVSYCSHAWVSPQHHTHVHHTHVHCPVDTPNTLIREAQVRIKVLLSSKATSSEFTKFHYSKLDFQG